MAQSVGPWFNGDRTLAQQMEGLDLLLESVRRKSVLDVGCAEGLIDFELIRAGALAIHGVEAQPTRVADANRLRGDMPCTFEQVDANTWRPRRAYHVVLLLSVLHKLKDPIAACMRFAEAASEMVVIRLPPNHANPVVIDSRSNNKPHHLGEKLKQAGFRQRAVARGHLDEWVGYYERNEWTA